jgi:hypothetical protein
MVLGVATRCGTSHANNAPAADYFTGLCNVNKSWRTMDLLQLEYFHALASFQHVTSAAADLL